MPPPTNPKQWKNWCVFLETSDTGNATRCNEHKGNVSRHDRHDPYSVDKRALSLWQATSEAGVDKFVKRRTQSTKTARQSDCSGR